MKTCRNRIPLVALCLMLLLPSCEETASPEISITLESDYSHLVAAIENVNQSLADRLSLLEAAMQSGLADDQTAIALVRKAVETLGGDLEKKLAAVLDAVRSQGTSLETKLALIEAAADAGFADAQARQALLQEALASLGGTLEEKIAALDKVVKKQSTGFETKLGLIEAAVKGGLADSVKAQKLLTEALDSLGGTLEEKLAAIVSALTSLSSGLETKLALIESAYTNGFSSETDALKQLQTAVSSLKGAVDGLDEDIDAVVSALGTVDPATGSISALLSQMQTSVSGVSGYEDVLKNILQTVEILSGKINGHAFVEMGDGRRWATCNVGAEHPWEKGDYFAWGETEPYYSSLSPLEWKEGKKDGYNWGSYSDNPSGDGITFTKYGGDLKLLLEPEDDAATVNWGGTWRTPSYEEWKWIETHCTAVWTDNYGGTGVQGIIMKSTVAGYTDRSIFFPATGYIEEKSIRLAERAFVWSARAGSADQSAAMLFVFVKNSGGEMSSGPALRIKGASIRAVSD